MKYYLYQHTRLDKDEIFYIGIGTRSTQDIRCNTYSRAYCKHVDNSIWMRIIAKTDWEYYILLESDNREEIEKSEKLLIQFFGRKIDNTGTLANMTLGGESNLGYKHTEEAKKKISEKASVKRGYSNIVYTNELKTKLSNIQKEVANRPDRIEYRRQLAKGNSYRSISVSLEEIGTTNIWKADSIKALSKICPLGYTTLITMKRKDPRCKLYNKYKLIIDEQSTIQE